MQSRLKVFLAREICLCFCLLPQEYPQLRNTFILISWLVNFWPHRQYKFQNPNCLKTGSRYKVSVTGFVAVSLSRCWNFVFLVHLFCRSLSSITPLCLKPTFCPNMAIKTEVPRLPGPAHCLDGHSLCSCHASFQNSLCFWTLGKSYFYFLDILIVIRLLFYPRILSILQKESFQNSRLQHCYKEKPKLVSSQAVITVRVLRLPFILFSEHRGSSKTNDTKAASRTENSSLRNRKYPIRKNGKME